jgi:hypothetical protein
MFCICRVSDRGRSATGLLQKKGQLPRFRRKGIAEGLHPGVGRNVKKTAVEAEVFQEGQKILIPRVAVEWKAPEIVEQNCRGNNVEYEQRRYLATIEVEQDANRTNDLEHAAGRQQ